MRNGVTSGGKHKFKLLLLWTLAIPTLQAAQQCATCHPKEVAGYQKYGMAHSLAPIGEVVSPPAGAFEHAFSQTKFSITLNPSGMKQALSRPHETQEQAPAFVIGSGNHALGYLTVVGDHVFQSPLSYYTVRHQWDVAPGYEMDSHPDFSRPVTAECLFCHSGRALPVADSLNRYKAGVFAAYGITCDRCHGDASSHLKNPVPGSILSPAKLTAAARASICEQCHLTGVARIPNPGKSITDFQPGRALEDYYSTYISAQSTGQSIKVVSHAEQLALSQCARKSGDKLWCGTCHNPHEKPAEPTVYYRDRCLTCHAATLDKAHAAPGRDCVACHMPKSPAFDGGHTAFTNHRIAINPNAITNAADADTLTAWREPDAYVRDRNLALALVTAGFDNGSSTEVIRGYRMINHLERDFPNDPALLTTIGSVLLRAKQPAEALKRFNKVILLKPDYAPYYVNAAAAMMALNQPEEAEKNATESTRPGPIAAASHSIAQPGL